jgi:F0F1-type ATP synthase membrane subunit b/b'
MDDIRPEWPYAPVQTETYSTPTESPQREAPTQEAPTQEASTQEGIDLSQPGQAVRAVLDQAQQRAGETVDQLKAQAGDVAVQVKNQAGTTVERLRSQADDQLDTQMTQAGAGLATVAEAVNTLGDQLRQGNQALLAGYADRVAGQVDQMAAYLRQSDPARVLHDIEDFARREPALFLTGAFAMGLLGTRFLKSSGRNVNTGGTAEQPETRQVNPGQ